MTCSTLENNLRINQGSRFRFTIKVLDGGVPVDLTGYSARMQIRKTVSDTATLAEYTTVDGTIVINVVEATVTIVVPSSMTNAYDWESGVYDLELVTPTNDAIRISEGWVSVIPQVTR